MIRLINTYHSERERLDDKDAEADKKNTPDVSTGNDESDGDAREEGRMDKDEDLKTGNDDQSPLAEHGKDKEYKITPAFFLAPDANKGHNKNTMDEQEERDPTEEDVPDLNVSYPNENKRKEKDKP